MKKQSRKRIPSNKKKSRKRDLSKKKSRKRIPSNKKQSIKRNLSKKKRNKLYDNSWTTIKERVNNILAKIKETGKKYTPSFITNTLKTIKNTIKKYTPKMFKKNDFKNTPDKNTENNSSQKQSVQKTIELREHKKPLLKKTKEAVKYLPILNTPDKNKQPISVILQQLEKPELEPQNVENNIIREIHDTIVYCKDKTLDQCYKDYKNKDIRPFINDYLKTYKNYYENLNDTERSDMVKKIREKILESDRFLKLYMLKMFKDGNGYKYYLCKKFLEYYDVNNYNYDEKIKKLEEIKVNNDIISIITKCKEYQELNYLGDISHKETTKINFDKNRRKIFNNNILRLNKEPIIYSTNGTNIIIPKQIIRSSSSPIFSKWDADINKRYVSLLYLLEKHKKNVCLYNRTGPDLKNNMTLLWDNRSKIFLNAERKPELLEDMKKIDVPENDMWGHIKRVCLDKDRKQRFIIIPLIIEYNDKLSHANYIIYDKQTNELERFEPHGTNYMTDSSIDDELLKLFKEKTKKTEKTEIKEIKDIKYFKPADFLPNVCFQSTQNIKDRTKFPDDNYKKNEDYKNYMGTCSLWSTWWADLRLSNPTVDRKELAKLAQEYLSNQEDFSLTAFITDYGNFIDEVYELSESE
jgi:hypothetical protein